MTAALVITVAGSATRFSRSLGRPALKCAYHEGDRRDALLTRMLSMAGGFDEVVVVGGFMFGELAEFVGAEPAWRGVRLVENRRFAELASGWSLKAGLDELSRLRASYDRVVFAEGDLWVDRGGFEGVARSARDAVTTCPEPILASRAVAFYEDMRGRFRYVYDTSHGALEIGEPFAAVFNSGQVWGFSDWERLERCRRGIPERAWRGTNLVLVNDYFGGVAAADCDLVAFGGWVNCNTVDDWRRARELSRGERSEGC